MIGCGALLFTVGLSPTGCGDVDAAFDCQAVCKRYQQCYNADYDVAACRDRCRTAAKNDPEIKNKADTCEACIDDMSCLSATFSCAGSCGAIVP
jgi:hypothetical protein